MASPKKRATDRKSEDEDARKSTRTSRGTTKTPQAASGNEERSDGAPSAGGDPAPATKPLFKLKGPKKQDVKIETIAQRAPKQDELKTIAKANGLPVGGSIEELKKRLISHDINIDVEVVDLRRSRALKEVPATYIGISQEGTAGGAASTERPTKRTSGPPPKETVAPKATTTKKKAPAQPKSTATVGKKSAAAAPKSTATSAATQTAEPTSRRPTAINTGSRTTSPVGRNVTFEPEVGGEESEGQRARTPGRIPTSPETVVSPRDRTHAASRYRVRCCWRELKTILEALEGEREGNPGVDAAINSILNVLDIDLAHYNPLAMDRRARRAGTPISSPAQSPRSPPKPPGSPSDDVEEVSGTGLPQPIEDPEVQPTGQGTWRFTSDSDRALAQDRIGLDDIGADQIAEVRYSTSGPDHADISITWHPAFTAAPERESSTRPSPTSSTRRQKSKSPTPETSLGKRSRSQTDAVDDGSSPKKKKSKTAVEESEKTQQDDFAPEDDEDEGEYGYDREDFFA